MDVLNCFSLRAKEVVSSRASEWGQGGQALEISSPLLDYTHYYLAICLVSSSILHAFCFEFMIQSGLKIDLNNLNFKITLLKVLSQACPFVICHPSFFLLQPATN